MLRVQIKNAADKSKNYDAIRCRVWENQSPDFFFFLCGTTVILLCLKEGKYLGYTVFRIYGFSLHLVLAMQVLTETFQNNKQKNMLLENQ